MLRRDAGGDLPEARLGHAGREPLEGVRPVLLGAVIGNYRTMGGGWVGRATALAPKARTEGLFATKAQLDGHVAPKPAGGAQ